MAKSNSFASDLFKLPDLWEKNNTSIWLASSISLSRNLNNFLFPSKLSTKKKGEILDVIKKELTQTKKNAALDLYKAETLTPLEKEFLHEIFLASGSFHHAQQGEGFLLDNEGKFILTVNLNDHLNFLSFNSSEDLEGMWNGLTKLEISLGEKVSYAYSDKFGFLTSNPASCGTALHATAYLQVPAVIHTGQLDEFLQTHEDPSITISGIQGKIEDGSQEHIGDILAVQNNYTLGVTEETILSSVRGFTTKLLVLEKSLRKLLKEEKNNAELKDKISRSYAILNHSYQIEAIEAMNALSLMKLGLELNWIENITTQELNALLFNCRRAHLMKYFKENITQDNLPHKRAEFLHETTRKAKLLI